MAFDARYYTHDSDKVALKALKAIPGFHQLVKGFMKIWSERQYRISNMSGCLRISEAQLPQYYRMLPPICEQLGIEVPELYLQLDVQPNAYTAGDTKPFIVMTSGLFETMPEELIPTVLAHECGHIACHHQLYTTIGTILKNGASTALRMFVPFGSIATLPLEMAFFYWMRCSELSADRAAVLCDGTPEKMMEVCLRFAGYDKDIDAIASKEAFLDQAREYKELVAGSKWDKTLEFLVLMSKSHPLTTVRALECEEWAKSEQYQRILDGTYWLPEPEEEEEEAEAQMDEPVHDTAAKEKKSKTRFEMPFELPKLNKKKDKEEQIEGMPTAQLSVPDEIRAYKALFDDGIITKEEFEEKKKQLLNL